MSIEDSLGEKEPGWHIFIHEPKENFTGKQFIFIIGIKCVYKYKNLIERL